MTQIPTIFTYVRSELGNDESALTEEEFALERANSGISLSPWMGNQLLDQYR